MYQKLKNLPRLLKRSLLYQTNEFFQVSTLHGVRYINEPGRPFIERFIWFAFTSIGAISAFIIIMNLWEKFQTNPTITGIKYFSIDNFYLSGICKLGVDSDFHYQKILFPTVVACPMVAHDSLEVNKLAKEILSIKSNDAQELNSTIRFLESLTKFDIHNAESLSKIAGKAIVDAVKKDNKILRKWVFKIAATCTGVLQECKYRDETIDCCDIFQPIYTNHGFCYAFNSQIVSKVSKDELGTNLLYLYEMDKNWALYFLPKRPIMLFILAEDELFGSEYQPITPWLEGETVSILGTKRFTITTDDARQLSISQRKCYFADEDAPKYFSNDIYRFTSCIKQCRMEILYKMCRCIVPYYTSFKKLRYCEIGDFPCLTKFRENITFAESCRYCHIGCNNSVFMVEKLSRGKDSADISGVTVQFLIWPAVRFKREVLFGWLDLLVSFGGIAGLFLGFSLLSAVEIIYYFTLRTVCMVYKNRRELEEMDNRIRNKAPNAIDMTLCSLCSDSDSDLPVNSKEVDSNIIQVQQAPVGFGQHGVVFKRRGYQDYHLKAKNFYRNTRGFPINLHDTVNINWSNRAYLP